MSQQFVEYVFKPLKAGDNTVSYIRLLLDVEVLAADGVFKSFPALLDTGGLILTIPPSIAEALRIEVPRHEESRVEIRGIVQGTEDLSALPHAVPGPPRAIAYLGRATVRLPDVPGKQIETECLFMKTPKDLIVLTLKEVAFKFDIASGTNSQDGRPGIILTLRDTESDA